MRSLHPWPIFPFNLDPPVARSLSIQFILEELISSFELIHHLQTITPEILQGANLKEEINLVIKKMEKLLLFSMDSPFAQKGSMLDKLCFYSEILLQASRIEDVEMILILGEMRNRILRVKTSMEGWKKMILPLDQILTILLELYADMHEKLCSFFHSFTQLLQEARSDENVLIYLIEKKDKLNTFLGKDHIERMLQKFFPSGHEQLRAIIIEGYSRRGFTPFLEKVEPLIDSIEWETPCHTTLTR